MIRGMAVYVLLLTFALLVWAGGVLVVLRFGWLGALAMGAGLLALYEVVFVGPADERETAR